MAYSAPAAREPMPGTLADWLARIGVEHPKGVLRGLAGVREVAGRLGVLPPAPQTIVVAGTNGKGSTTLFAEQLLLAADRRVGATVSPHVHRFNERIRLNGQAAEDADVVAALETVERHRGATELSYFEYAILAALVAIRRAEVDVAVLEVGLGGRLDAVNAVDADVAVITNIALDHQEYLGDDRECIGREKAGILRRGRPVVVGEAEPPATVLAQAAALAAPVHIAGVAFGHTDRALWLTDGGRHVPYHYQAVGIAAANAATALQAVALTGCRLCQWDVDAAAATRNPGRFEVATRHGRTWVVDVAHNPAAAAFLAQQVRQRFPNGRIAAVVGCLVDKDVAGIVQALRPLVQSVAYVDTLPPRGRSGVASRAAAHDLDARAGDLDAVLTDIVRQPDNDTILLLGSFDVVQRVRQRLRLPN